jgi:Spy/CpxP family protein refolding chaperone
MRMKMVAAGVAAGAVLAGTLLAAEPPMRREGRGGRGARDGAAAYLGLTDEQKAQLAEQREAARPQAQALFGKVQENRERLRQALAAATPDPAVVGSIAIEGHRLQQQLKAQREAGEKALRAILTPEQQTKLDALQALRSGPGRRGPGPMGPMLFGPPPGDDGPDGPGDEPPQE